MTLSAGAAEAWALFGLDGPGGSVERRRIKWTCSYTIPHFTHDAKCSALNMSAALLCFGKTDWVWVQSVFK